MRFVSKLVLLFAFFSCKTDDSEKSHLPSPVYNFVEIDTAALSNKHFVYVPVYSHIYSQMGTRAINLTATLSIRNTSYTDSFYVTNVIYYGSQGELLKSYLNATVLVKPMTSIEFVVEERESKGGAGANFVVKWGANDSQAAPLIQAVMNSTTLGVSFITDAVEMRQK